MSGTTPSPDLAAILTDRYRIERELGQGGMATRGEAVSRRLAAGGRRQKARVIPSERHHSERAAASRGMTTCSD